MGCSSCGKATATNLNTSRAFLNKSIQQPIGPCEYTNEILNVWLSKLKWFKDSGSYIKHNIKAGILNKYLGIVLTSINVNKKCNYKEMLDTEIKKLVTFITGLQNA